MDHDPIYKEFVDFVKSFISYLTFRIVRAGLNFEKVKDAIVDILMVKRGVNTSLFVHGSILSLAVVVLVGGGILLSTSVISGSYPGVPANPLVAGASTGGGDFGVITSTITPVTIISDKPRDEVIQYEVREGDTVSLVASEYGVSEETIFWENDLDEKSLIEPGEKIRILPVSGVAHKVVSGDTIYSIAKKYRANAQAILDFPFNDVGQDFQLASGDVIIVPDGAPPEAPKPLPTQYLASEKQNVTVDDLGTTQFAWPASGDLAQYFAWYHPAIDISNLGGGSIRASDSGTVTVAGFVDGSGYGNRVIIDHGNGYTTLYAHLSANYVVVGQKVAKGEVIGAMGSTGRSSGVHLHLEIRRDGTALNPLSILGK